MSSPSGKPQAGVPGVLTGRTALVTGATRGIGKGIALSMADAGARVIITGRGEANGRAIVEELNQRHGGGYIASDLNKDEDVDALVPEAINRFGSLDILVNNAGIDADNLVMNHPLEDWRRVIRINLEVPFRLCKAAGAHFLPRKRGVVINVASILGLVGAPEASSYCASKHGLIGFSKTLALEWASSGVRVNVIAPGLIRTDMTEYIWGTPGFDISSRIPSGRIGTPDDIGAAAVFLASDAADFVHGQVLTVDGGRLAR